MNTITISVENTESLRELLGDRFSDFNSTTSLSADPRLVALALDADNPQAMQIASCLCVESSQSVAAFSL